MTMIVNHEEDFNPLCDMTRQMMMVMMIILIVVIFVTITKLIMMILIFDDDDHVKEEEFLSCQSTSGCVSNCWQLKPSI